MKTIISALVGLAVLASLATPSAAYTQCTLKGWKEGMGGGPIFECPKPNV